MNNARWWSCALAEAAMIVLFLVALYATLVFAVVTATDSPLFVIPLLMFSYMTVLTLEIRRDISDMRHRIEGR